MSSIAEYTKRGIKLYETGNHSESLKFFEKAYREMTDQCITNHDVRESVIYNLALTYYSLRLYKLAEENYEKLSEYNYQGMYELSMTKFFLHKLKSGAKLYPNRYLRDAFDSPKFPVLPLKKINRVYDLTDRSVIVLNEQGIGDELMFMRSIHELSNRVKYAKVQVYPELRRVLEENIDLPNIEFFTDRSFNSSFLNGLDGVLYLGDLWTMFMDSPPLVLETPVEAAIIDVDPGMFHVGFVCACNKKSSNAKQRSVPEEIFKTLSKRPNHILHSLMIDRSFKFAVDHRDKIKDFFDTLSIIDSLDAVVTIDTSVAHLAAASGTPTYLIYNEYLDWRWTNGFYPNVTVVIADQLKKLSLNK